MKDARGLTSAALALLVATACAGRAPTNDGDDDDAVPFEGEGEGEGEALDIVIDIDASSCDGIIADGAARCVVHVAVQRGRGGRASPAAGPLDARIIAVDPADGELAVIAVGSARVAARTLDLDDDGRVNIEIAAPLRVQTVTLQVTFEASAATTSVAFASFDRSRIEIEPGPFVLEDLGSVEIEMQVFGAGGVPAAAANVALDVEPAIAGLSFEDVVVTGTDGVARVVISGTEDLDTIVESTLRATYTSDLGNAVSASVAIRVEGTADP